MNLFDQHRLSRRRLLQAAGTMSSAMQAGRHIQGSTAAQPTNGDEERYPDYLASYSKALPHNDRGEVIPLAYAAHKVPYLHRQKCTFMASFCIRRLVKRSSCVNSSFVKCGVPV